MTDAQVDSKDYNITQQYLDEARVDRENQPKAEVFPDLDPHAIKRAVGPVPDTYQKT